MSSQQKDKELQEGKFFAVIAYISFLCIISLAFKKDNKFALYHAKQGLALFVLEVAALIISVIPIIWWLRPLGFALFGLASLWCILQSLMGNYNRLPFISNIADKIII